MDELRETAANIRSILLRHGGAWYTSDLETEYDQIAAIAVDNPDALHRFAVQTQKTKKKTDIYFFSSTFETLLAKQQFFESCGLRVEKMPFYTDDTKLNALAMFPPKIQEKMITQMKTFAVWKMTATDLPEGTEILQGESSSNNLLQQYALSNKTLKIVMEGRLDTLNAPAFLKLYEDMAEKENIKSVELEIRALDYMSSTGLRVLLRISKQLGKENVIVKHPNAVIHEILKGSGFDEVVTIQ